ncbi:hypothetical protein [Fodinibius halophilus]|uniref:DinB family protein n=1 Tax=Fodinibius halophilus TaxID=1736908 RepID=A0A6M1T0R6_9BACT|nr:hypothetical protein [Fodinibius halophilus]NGP89076.1 hypothetical protein [Fodinibius halophilus]
MMADREITQDEINELIEDASYLQDEAEAMQYVIDNVPYEERPPEGRSISEMLLLIDHAQLSYYRPILEKAVENKRPTHLDNYTHYRENFEPDEDKMKDVQKVLKKLAKHRAGLVNSIKSISLIDWETVVYRDDQQILLYDFMQEMIRFERGMLRDIAEQVKVYNQEKERMREIKQRRSQRESQQPTENS